MDHQNAYLFKAARSVKDVEEIYYELEDTIELSEELENLCEDIDKLALKQDAPIAISLGYIVESIRRIGEYAEDISETVINHLIGQERT